MTLNRCLRIMRDNQDRTGNHKQHVPFRDSKLTGFFKHSLTSKNASLMMVVNINPNVSEHSETISVLDNSSIAKDVTYQKPIIEKRHRAVRYDKQGRRIKSRKELAAESKRLIEAATATKARKKKIKLATSQNVGNVAEVSNKQQHNSQNNQKVTSPTNKVSSIVLKQEDLQRIRDEIREQVVNEYRATMQKVMHMQLMTAQKNTDDAIAEVESLWQARLDEINAEHERVIKEMQSRDIDDKDTLHIEIDGLTCQKVSLREKLQNLQDENESLRKQLELQKKPLQDVQANSEDTASSFQSTSKRSAPKLSLTTSPDNNDENLIEVLVPVTKKRYNLRKRN